MRRMIAALPLPTRSEAGERELAVRQSEVDTSMHIVLRKAEVGISRPYIGLSAPMAGRFWLRRITLLLIFLLPVWHGALSAATVRVRHIEGLVHGFLVLRTLEGDIIAQGDLTQVARGDRVTSHLAFHFKDGSLDEETVIFSQHHKFRLLSDRLLQRGPAFKHPMELSINGVTGRVVVRYTDDDGKEKVVTDRLKLPPDVANGMVPTLLKNVLPNVPQTRLSIVVATPKPRLVKLVITPGGEDSFSISGSVRKATRYIVKVEIGGVAGLVAPLVGKQPQDSYVWILGGTAPAFVKSEGPLYEGGPSWRIELASPLWPRVPAADPSKGGTGLGKSQR